MITAPPPAEDNTPEENHDALFNEIVYQPMKMVHDFHKAFNIKPFIEQPDAFGRKKLLTLRLQLIREEYHEVVDELLDALGEDGDWLALAKELADLLYVVYGTADALDIPLEDAFREVHRSNMSKLGKDGKPVYRDDGKVLKGPLYKEADMQRVFFGVSD